MPAPSAPSAFAVSTAPSSRSGRLLCQRLLPLWAALGLCQACFSNDEGVAPPADQLNFPVGVALDPSGDRLFVASSDFDLRFNGGIVQVLDAAAIRSHLPQACQADSDCPAGWSCPNEEGLGSTLCVDPQGSMCGELGEQSSAQRAKHPGACNPLPLDTDEVLLDAARIGPFVADVKYVPAALDGSRSARIVMPVRGDATLHWADVKSSPDAAGSELDCGQSSRFGDCDGDHRRGDSEDERAQDGTKLPTEPFGLAASADGGTLFVGHQSQGKLSVFANTPKGPQLQTVLTGLPSNPMGLAVVPPPRAAQAMGLDYTLGVLVSFRYYSGSPNVELLRYYDEVAAAPAVPYLSRVGAATITLSNNGLDSRGLAVDASGRSACETRCDTASCAASEPGAAAEPGAPDSTSACDACLLECAQLPLDVYVANRSPHSLLIGQTRSSEGELGRDDLPDFTDSEAMRGGPSRVILANVVGSDGELKPRVFVLAFNSQLVYVFDPALRRVEAHIETGPGPQALVVDEKRALGYLAHFTDSYLSVIDLDQRHSSFGRILLNVGVPEAPRSSK